MAATRGLGPARLAADGTALDAAMSGAARRWTCLLPRLAARGWEPILFVSAHAAAPYLDLAGVTTIPLPVPAHPAPLRLLAARRRIAPILAREKVRVFLTDVPQSPPGPPTVLTVHDLRAWDAPALVPWGRRLWLRRALPRALRTAAAVVTPSRSTGERLQHWFPETRPVVAPNGCDHFPVPGEWPAREHFLLAVGPWDRRKGLETLLEAHARACPERELRIVGEGLRREGRNVRPVGADDVALAEMYRRAAAVICPSRYEGFDLPLAEALAQGAPVVASDLPVHREVAAETARYFAPGNAPALAAALAKTLQEPGDARARLMRAAEFSWRRTAETLDPVLRRVAGVA